MIPLHVLLFFAFTVGTLGVLLLAAWSRRETAYRWILILLGCGVIVVSYPTFVGLLSRPRTVDEEWYHRHVKEARVAGVFVDEGVALYLYLVLPGMNEPRSYKYPWNDENRKLAESLQDALGSEEGKAGVIVPLPFEPSLEREKPLTAHPIPQPAVPEKNGEQPEAPIQYRSASYVITEFPWWRRTMGI